MKFQDILEANIPKEREVLEMYHNIYQNCQPFLQQIHSAAEQFVMYRGMTDRSATGVGMGDGNYVGMKDVRLGNRLPMDMSQQNHDSINEYLESTYGHPYRNGMFVTGDANTASGYGYAYAVFPIGKFDFIWNPNIKDLFVEVGEEDTGPGSNWQNFADNMGLSPEQKETVTDDYTAGDLLAYLVELEAGDYKSGDLKEGLLAKRTEIMVWVERYYWMHPAYLTGFESWLSK